MTYVLIYSDRKLNRDKIWGICSQTRLSYGWYFRDFFYTNSELKQSCVDDQIPHNYFCNMLLRSAIRNSLIFKQEITVFGGTQWIIGMVSYEISLLMPVCKQEEQKVA